MQGSGCRVLDAGVLDAGVLDAGGCMQANGFVWMQGAGCRGLDAGVWMQGSGCRALDSRDAGLDARISFVAFCIVWAQIERAEHTN